MRWQADPHIWDIINGATKEELKEFKKIIWSSFEPNETKQITMGGKTYEVIEPNFNYAYTTKIDLSIFWWIVSVVSLSGVICVGVLSLLW